MLTTHIPDTQKQPTIGTSDTVLNGTYLFIMMGTSNPPSLDNHSTHANLSPPATTIPDLDVPSSFTGPSTGPRRTNLHAMITGFKSSTSGVTSGGIYTLTSTATGPVKYVTPAPPAETPAHAHRYVELLFETEAGFAVPQAYVKQTLVFYLPGFIQKTGLGPPVRGNWFNVTG